MRYRHMVVVGVLVTGPASTLSAQRLWLTDDHAQVAGIEIAKGFFAQDNGFSPQFAGASSVATVFGRVRLDSKLMVTAEIPFAHVEEEPLTIFSTRTRTTNTFGNPWIGIQADANPSTAIEVGFRPGLASDLDESAGQSLGALLDFDHFDAWYSSATVFGALVRAGRVPDRGLFTVGVVGGTFAFETSSNGPAYADYGLRVGERWPSVIASLALSGHLILNQCSGCTIDERMVNQLAATVVSVRGRFQPEAGVRVFLDPSFRDYIKATAFVGTTLRF
ncbi:MAG TPA: hypothetical protein VGL65_13620 [Gemmatimonadales bacterium]|jgi:hypothetical protein